MSDKILVFYGSDRSDRQGIRLADYLVESIAAPGARPELMDARALDLPILDRMYKEYAPGTAPRFWRGSHGRSDPLAASSRASTTRASSPV